MLSRAPLLALPVLLVGCGCSDQGFQPLTWADLDADYGKWLSMDVDPYGRPVIAYYDVTNGGLGFAIGDLKSTGEVQWKHEQVDGYAESSGLDTGDVGQWASMKVAPDGTVWIAYYGAGALKVAHRVDGVWTKEVADAGSGLSPDCGQWASLDLDSQGRPVVAHHNADKGDLRVARHLDGAWTAETVHEGMDWTGTDAEGNAITRPASVGMFARLLIEGDTEYIAFYDAAAQNLQLLEGFAGAYAHSVVHEVDGGNVGLWPSLWTDGTTLAVAFEDRANGDLLFAKRDGGGTFTVETVDADDFVGSDTEIFSRGGDFSILYFDGRYNDMKLATHDESGWATEKLGGDDAAVGFFNEVIETRGAHYVASYDYSNKHLFFRPL